MRIDEILNEGVNDKHIFKAIFFAGGPGSGKNYVESKTTSEFGLRTIDSDVITEYYTKYKIRELNLQKVKKIHYAKTTLYLDGRLGVVIQGTGQNLGPIQRNLDHLEELGYDAMMIFVNTELDIALKRNINRDRTVYYSSVIKIRDDGQNNMDKLKKMFGSNFHTVNNNDDGSDNNELNELSNKVRQFVNRSVNNPVALQWIEDQRKQNENR